MQQNTLRWSIRALIGFSTGLIIWALLNQLRWTITSRSQRAVEEFDFEDTQEEKKCFQGGVMSSTEAYGSRSIPNIVHFIWGMKEQDPEISFIHYLAIRSALLSIRPTEVKIHYAFIKKESTWLQKLKKNVTFVQHDLESEFGGQINNHWQTAHVADVLRLDILHKEGGIYLDIDVISLKPFHSLRSNAVGVVLGNEGGDRHGLCNGVILARSGSRFIKRWIESYTTFKKSEWNYHSVILPQQLALQYPEEVCQLSPTVFFWPTWTKNHIQYMHKPLSPAEARLVERQLTQHGGSFYDTQLAYHAWSHMSWTPWLKDLTPQDIRTKDTRFNIMVRRFLYKDD